jgi:hypothetical protein
MHKPNLRQRETRALAFWRAVDAELRALGAPRLGFQEVNLLHFCGYSVEDAIRAVAPVRRREDMR